MRLRSFAVALSALGTTLATSNSTVETIYRDVAIIGGGSAGTYTAIRLQQLGKSVALIEKAPQLGGHVNTFVDSRTNATFDYGVVIFSNNSLVRDYFGHLDVPLKNFTGFVQNETSVYANLATGANASPLAFNCSLADTFIRYRTQLEKYPYLSTGWHLEYPLPEDFFLPFGDFLEKYNLGAMASTLLAGIGGCGNLLAQPTLYILKQFSLDMVQRTLTNSLVTSAHSDNQALYNSALGRLGNGENAFVESRVTKVDRSGANGTTVHVDTPNGKKVIHASKLVMAIPPKLEHLNPFLDLSDDEYTYFSQFNNSYIWANVVANSGIPQSASLSNVNAAAAIGVPAMPAVFGTAPTLVKDLHIAWYGSPYELPNWKVKQNIEAAFNRWKRQTGNETSPPAEVIQIKNHTPYLLEASMSAVQAGFYDGLNDLQGEQGTYWTGATFQSHDSTAIWNFTEHDVLPMILGNLNGSAMHLRE